MSDVAIMNALFARLNSLTLSPVHPIAWPNTNFTPPTNGRFLRATFLPANKTRFAIPADSINEHVGIMQVDVFGPLTVGASVPMATAQAVADHLKSGWVSRGATRVEIVSAIIQQGSPSGSSFILPVSIRYRAFAPN